MSEELDFSHAAMTSGPSEDPNAPPFFTYDDDGHPRCNWRGKNRWPSVGRAMKRVARIFAPWLVEERTPESDARKERGKRIHEVLSWLDKGMRVAYEPFYQPYIDGWMAGCAELGIEEWEDVEKPCGRVVGETVLWGIPDRAISSLIADYKSTENLKNQKPSNLIQVAGYMWITGAPRGCVIYGDPAGAHEVVWVGPKDMERWMFVVENIRGTGSGEGDE